MRAFAGLVPHFHGGRFEGRVEVDGRDTRRVPPADLAGTVATVFQDPEEQVVLNGVAREVSFGLENLGVAPEELMPRAHEALAAVGAAHPRRPPRWPSSPVASCSECVSPRRSPSGPACSFSTSPPLSSIPRRPTTS